MEKIQIKPIVIVLLVLATALAFFKIWKNVDSFYSIEKEEIVTEEPLVDLSKFSITGEKQKVKTEEEFSLKSNIEENGTYKISYPCDKNVSLSQTSLDNISCDTPTTIIVDNKNITGLKIKSDNAAEVTVPITIDYTENKTNRKATGLVQITVENNLLKNESN